MEAWVRAHERVANQYCLFVNLETEALSRGSDRSHKLLHDPTLR